MAYLTGYAYRKEITITSSAAATDYQFLLILHRNKGIDTDGAIPVIYLGKTIQTDFDDIRFTSDDGETLLDFSLVQVSSTTPYIARVFVEVPTVAEGDTTIYLYYHNPTATTASSAANTFPLADTFVRANSATVGGGWTEEEGVGTLSIDTNRLKVDCALDAYCHAEQAAPAMSNLVLYGQVYIHAGTLASGWSTGINLYWDVNDWIKASVRQSSGLKVGYHKAVNGTVTAVHSSTVTPNSWVYLKIELGTSLVTIYYSTDGFTYTSIGSITRAATWSGAPALVIVGRGYGDGSTYANNDLDNSKASTGAAEVSYLRHVYVTNQADTPPTLAVGAQECLDATLACVEPIRRIHGRVTIYYSGPDVDSGLTVTSSGDARGTDKEDTIDSSTGAAFKWFALGDNVLDGSYHPAPTDTVGWWSSTAADGSAEFDPAVWLQVEFDTAKTIDTLTIYGDDKLEGYPVDFTIKLYDSSDNLDHTETVTGNTSVNWSTTIDAHADIKKMKLEVTKINRASVPCRVTEFYSLFQETYEDDELFLISLLEEMDYQGATIPIGNISANEITVRIDNSTGRFNVDNPSSSVAGEMKKNRVIEAFLGIEVPYGGTVTWYTLGKFYTQDWRVYNDAPYVEIVGLDKLSLLGQSEFYTTQIYSDQTLTALAEVVLADAGLASAEYSIDTALDSITIPYTWFGRTTHRYALKEIAEACSGRVYMNRNNVVVIEPYQDATTSSTTITSDRYFSKSNPIAWNEIVNYVEVRAKPRILASSATEIYNDTEALAVPAGGSATRLCIFNTDDPCTEVATPSFTQSSTHITISSHTDYTWATLITFANSGGGEESVTSITIDGKILSTAGNKVATAEDTTSIAENGRQALTEPVENNYIQSKARAQTIADALLASYKDPRRDVELDCRGYVDITLGDRISVATYDDDHTTDYTVIRQELRWDGGLRAEITGRKI